jgi:hypothetical protein
LGSGVLASLLRLVRPSHLVALQGAGRGKQVELPVHPNAALDFLGPDAAAASPTAPADGSGFDRADPWAPPLWAPRRTVLHGAAAAAAAEVGSSSSTGSSTGMAGHEWMDHLDRPASSSSSSPRGGDGEVWGEVHVVDSWDAAFKRPPGDGGAEGDDKSDEAEDGHSGGGGAERGGGVGLTTAKAAALPLPAASGPSGSTGPSASGPSASGPSAADLRSVRTAAYFALLLQQPQAALGVAVRNGALSDPTGSLAHALAARSPLRAPLAALALLAPGDVPGQPALASATEVLHAFNGALVALLDHRPATAATRHLNPPGGGGGAGYADATDDAGAAAPTFPLAEEAWQGERLAAVDGGGWLPLPGARCVGLGLVRSLDLARGAVYLLTPAPPASLRQCAALSRAPVGAGPGTSLSGLPPQLLLDPKASAFPYLFCEALTTGGGAVMKSRNNLVRGGGEAAPR